MGVGVGAYLIALLVIPLLGPGWHALHGDFIFLDGWKIPVPKGFYVTKYEKDRAVWRQTLGIPLLNVPYGHISLYHLPPSPHPFVFDRDYAHFRKAAIQAANHSVYNLNSEHTVSAETVSGYCWINPDAAFIGPSPPSQRVGFQPLPGWTPGPEVFGVNINPSVLRKLTPQQLQALKNEVSNPKKSNPIYDAIRQAVLQEQLRRAEEQRKKEEEERKKKCEQDGKKDCV